jgi:hypothetical protein
MAFWWFKEKFLRKLSKKYSIRIASIIVIIMSAIYSYSVHFAVEYKYPHWYYSKWYYILWIICLFWSVLLMEIKNNKLAIIIERLAKNKFTVYLGHLPLLLYITSIRLLTSLGEAIITIVILFTVLEVLAKIFRKIPFLRKIV